MLRKIEIGNDKVITFKTISEAFNVGFNKSSAGPAIANLGCKEDRVYLRFDTQPGNLKISDHIAREIENQTR